MGEVVGFPGGKPRAEKRDRAHIEADRVASGRRVRSRLEKPWPLKPGQQEDVARALHAVLERVAALGIRKADILRRAGLQTEGDPTKHLSQYVLPAGLTEDEVERRRGRLRKKAEAYGRIAEAAAELAGFDPSDVLGEVFAAALLDLPETGSQGLDSHDEMAVTLRKALNGIALRFDLGTYFREVEASGLLARVVRTDEAADKDVAALQPEDLDVVFDVGGRYEWDIRFGQPNHQAGHEGEDCIVSYPGVSLGEWRVGACGPLRLIAADDLDPPAEATTNAEFIAELRLCIAPIEPSSRPEPALRVALRARLEPATLVVPNGSRDAVGGKGQNESGPTCRRVEFDNYWQLPAGVGAIVSGRCEGDGEFVRLRVEAISKPVPAVVRRFFGDAVRDRGPVDGVRFLPIDGGILRDWLAFDVMNDEDEFWADRTECHAFRGGQHGAANVGLRYGGYSPLPPGTLAAALDRSLWAMRDSILERLASQTEQLVQAFRSAVEQQAKLRRERLREIERQWAATEDQA